MGLGRVCSHYRHEAGAREALGGVLVLVARGFRGVLAAACGRWLRWHFPALLHRSTMSNV